MNDYMMNPLWNQVVPAGILMSHQTHILEKKSLQTRAGSDWVPGPAPACSRGSQPSLPVTSPSKPFSHHQPLLTPVIGICYLKEDSFPLQLTDLQKRWGGWEARPPQPPELNGLPPCPEGACCQPSSDSFIGRRAC